MAFFLNGMRAQLVMSFLWHAIALENDAQHGMEQDYEAYVQAELASKYSKLAPRPLCTLEWVQHSVLHSDHNHLSKN
jgi:hypothetical protein